MKDQKTTTKSTENVAPSTNNSGKSAMFISLIALGVASYTMLMPEPTPKAPKAPNVDLSKIQHKIDKISSSVLKDQQGIKDNIDAVTNSVVKAHKILEKMNLSIVETRHILDYEIATSAERFEQQKGEVSL